jgi:hypothetical protein
VEGAGRNGGEQDDQVNAPEGVEVTRHGPVELRWDPERRLGELRFVEAGVGGGDEAEALVGRLGTWVDAGDGGPFRLLVDCSEMVDVDAGWRNIWGDFFMRERHRSVAGWFNAGPRIRLAIIMFQKGTGVTGEAFETEAEARAYLARMAAAS